MNMRGEKPLSDKIFSYFSVYMNMSEQQVYITEIAHTPYGDCVTSVRT